MTIDIVKRLRHTEEHTATIGKELVYLQVPVNPDGPEAADYIEQLREENKQYLECLTSMATAALTVLKPRELKA